MVNAITILAAIVNFLLGVIVITRSSKRPLYYYFSLFSFLTSIWVLTNFLFSILPSILILRSQYATGAAIIPLAMVWFEFLLSKKPRKLLNAFMLFIALFLLILPFINGFIVKELSVNNINGTRELHLGPLFDFYSIIILILFLYLCLRLVVSIKRNKGARKTQLKYIMLGVSLYGGISMVFSFILPFFHIRLIAPIDAQSSLFFVGFSAYAILRHRLLDIRLVILRTITYSLVVLLISTVVVGLTLLLPEALAINNTARIAIAIGTAIFVVLILEPLKRFIGRTTDKLFYKGRVDYRSLLAEVTEVINREIDINVLVREVNDLLSKGLKIKSVSIYLKSKSGGSFFRRGNGGNIVLEKGLTDKNALINHLKREKETIILETIERKIEEAKNESERKTFEKVKEELDRYEAGVVIPIIADRNLNAAMILGPKLSGDTFSNDDINLVELLSPQLASAIEKARLYEEVKNFSLKLQDEVKKATADLRFANLTLKERNQFLAALQAVTNLITRSLDFKKVIQTIVDSIHEKLGYVGGILLLVDKEKGIIYPAAVTETSLTKKALGLLPKPMTEYFSVLKEDKTLDGLAIKEQTIKIGSGFEEFISPPVPKMVSLAIDKVLGLKAIVAVPIFSENEVIGVIDFGLQKAKEKISPAEIEMMKSLADQTGIITRNLKLFEAVRKANDELAQINKHLEQLDQAKSEFLSIASHQLRTPISGILGYLSMLLEGDFGALDPKKEKIVAELLDASRRMARMINIFLNVTRIEAGRLIVQKQETDMIVLAEAVIKELQESANKKNLSLELIKPAKKIPTVMVDQDKIKDVLGNLVDNAIKYTQAGGIKISFAADPDYLTVAVKDTGVGIAKPEVSKLFNKFVRGSGIARIQPDGSGLGLFIAKKLTEANQGRIWVESEGEGEGTTFKFALPLKGK